MRRPIYWESEKEKGFGHAKSLLEKSRREKWILFVALVNQRESPLYLQCLLDFQPTITRSN